ncbi:MAG: GAF domain-containing sensor histidine kinase [Anaerolineales bacterium]|nr:GAF domain-containing sensor histidine kinase [Anaerolineales bacterium]
MGEEVVGVLVVESRRPHAFDQEDFHLLSSAATQAGFALGWARSLGETQQRVAELVTINYISQALVSQLDLEALFELTGEQVCQNFAAQVVHVALYDPQTQLIHFPYKFDRGQRLTNEAVPYGQGLVSKIIRSGQPLLINSNLQQYKAELGLDTPAGLPSKSYLGVPITVNDPGSGQAVIGVISVQSTERENYFDESDMRLLVTIAAHVGVAIHNARLFAETRQAREAAEAANLELSQTLQDLRAAQTQLVEAEKMAALGGLVAGVAHEINTPIGVGVTAASLLAEKTDDLRDTFRQGQMKRSDLEKYLDLAGQSSQMILSNLNRAADLIQSFKQVAVDQSSEERRAFPVKAYLEEILLSLRPKLKRTNLTVKINGDDDLSLDSYPGSFAQIVTNLVMNSLMHAYDPDQAGYLVFEVKRKGSRFIFKYSDDGKGIPKENLNKIFEPFFTTQRGRGGSGLGLHIIYNIVTQKLGGNIRCESEVGVGTKFTINVPLEIDKTLRSQEKHL